MAVAKNGFRMLTANVGTPKEGSFSRRPAAKPPLLKRHSRYGGRVNWRTPCVRKWNGYWAASAAGRLERLPSLRSSTFGAGHCLGNHSARAIAKGRFRIAGSSTSCTPPLAALASYATSQVRLRKGARVCDPWGGIRGAELCELSGQPLAIALNSENVRGARGNVRDAHGNVGGANVPARCSRLDPHGKGLTNSAMSSAGMRKLTPRRSVRSVRPRRLRGQPLR